MYSENPTFETRVGLERFLDRLMHADWESPNSPIQFRSDLTVSDLSNSSFFKTAHLILTTLLDENGTEMTTSSNLNRAFVKRIFDRMDIFPPQRESLTKICKVINEQNIGDLHTARVVCECAGLISKRKKRFVLTRAAKAFIPDERAGLLFRHLFISYFRRFNLGYQFPFREVPTIQDTMALILWRLNTVARDWVPVKGLASKILRLFVLEELRAAMTYEYDKEEWILAGYVLNPLLDWGLIEKKDAGDWPSVVDKDEIRLTPLWNKLIRFETPRNIK